MKKAICILLTLLIFTGTLAGCGKDNANETTTGTAAQTTVETTAAEETTTSAPVLTDEQILALSESDFNDYLQKMNEDNIPDYQEQYDRRAASTARQFINFIKAKKVDDIAYFIGNNNQATKEACKVFEKVDVDSYEIVPDPSESSDFLVTLHISKSDSALFPVGTSRWILSTESNLVTAISMFRNARDTVVYEDNPYFLNAVDFCYRVSARLGCFETMDDFNKLVTNVKARDDFDSFCGPFISLLLRNRDGYYPESAYPVKRTELETLAKKTFGITNIDFKKYCTYNSTDDTLFIAGGGFPSYPVTLSSSTYDQSARIRTILLDFYSDGAYLFKAKTMKYTLRENSDGSLTLLSTRLVYDSGYQAWVLDLGI